MTMGGSKLAFISLSIFLIILNKKGNFSIINLLKIEYVGSNSLKRFPEINFENTFNIISKFSFVSFEIILSVTIPLYIGLPKMGKKNPPKKNLNFNINF